jgi:hypothetical protein
VRAVEESDSAAWVEHMREPTAAVPHRPPTGFCGDFIREHQEEILVCWESRVRTLPAARKLDHATLLDHIPHVLHLVAAISDRLCVGGRPPSDAEVVESAGSAPTPMSLHAAACRGIQFATRPPTARVNHRGAILGAMGVLAADKRCQG